MSALGPSSLGVACRTIYVRAGEDHILPPLIRDAADPDPPQRVIEAAGEDFALVFRVRYDARPRAAAGGFGEPPLRFEIEATAGTDNNPATLTDAERFELIRAFMLGVREPLVVETPSETDDWRLAIKLASRFVMWAPRAEPLDVGLSMDEICERLAARLMDGSEGLFATHSEGVDVWKTRLREELFGEPRLGPDDLWPVEAPLEAFDTTRLPALPAAARRRLPPVAARAAARPAPRRRAVAAAIALVGLAALAAALASQGRRRQGAPAPDAVMTTKNTEAAPAPSRRAAVETHAGPHVQVASLDERSFWSPDATDARFTALAPTVAQATLALTAPAIAPASAHLSAAQERPGDPAKVSPPAAAKRPGPAEAHPAGKRSPLAKIDGAVKKIVKSIGALRLPRVKLTALNSPHAAGPRRP
jgi:hypothetical protein